LLIAFFKRRNEEQSHHSETNETHHHVHEHKGATFTGNITSTGPVTLQPKPEGKK